MPQDLHVDLRETGDGQTRRCARKFLRCFSLRWRCRNLGCLYSPVRTPDRWNAVLRECTSDSLPLNINANDKVARRERTASCDRRHSVAGAVEEVGWGQSPCLGPCLGKVCSCEVVVVRKDRWRAVDAVFCSLHDFQAATSRRLRISSCRTSDLVKCKSIG